jgi:hypothetical protein
MRSILALIITMFCAAHPARAEAEADRPLLVAMPVRHVFVPAGFDDNDDVQVVLEGTFPDTCYKLAHNEVIKLDGGKGFQLIQWARKFSGICIPTTVPFQGEVTLGQLPAGTYRIESSGTAPTALRVTTAISAQQDDFLYAPVTNATVGRQNSGHYTVTLTGNLPNDCFTFDKPEVRLSSQVFVILPLLRYQDTGTCSKEPKSFEQKIDLPDDLQAGKYLAHVRSMSGQAINVIFFADGD